MGCETRQVAKNRYACELERTEKVSIFLSPSKTKEAEKFEAPWVRIEHSRKGNEIPGEYCVTYRDGRKSSRLEFEISINDGKVSVNSKEYSPSEEEYARARYDPFNEGVSLPESIAPCHIHHNGNEATVRPDQVGSFENYKFPGLDLNFSLSTTLPDPALQLPPFAIMMYMAGRYGFGKAYAFIERIIAGPRIFLGN